MFKMKISVDIVKNLQHVLTMDKIVYSVNTQFICATLVTRRNLCLSASRLCPSNDNSTVTIAKEASRALKVLKIAIIGIPNSGKSTLINEILNRRVSITKK